MTRSDPEDYLAAVFNAKSLPATRSGAEQRIRCRRFPARKTFEDFDCGQQTAVRQQITALAGGAS